MQYCSIIPKEAVEKYKTDFRRHPVGTGPFQFVAWEEGQALILKKNEKYFEKDAAGNPLPYLDGIKVSFYDSKATEFLEFQQNRLDFIDDIDPSFKDEVLTKTGNLKKDWQGKIELHKHPYLNIEYLGILVDGENDLVKNSPLRLQKIRQAINYGFNRRNPIFTSTMEDLVGAIKRQQDGELHIFRFMYFSQAELAQLESAGMRCRLWKVFRPDFLERVSIRLNPAMNGRRNDTTIYSCQTPKIG